MDATFHEGLGNMVDVDGLGCADECVHDRVDEHFLGHGDAQCLHAPKFFNEANLSASEPKLQSQTNGLLVLHVVAFGCFQTKVAI